MMRNAGATAPRHPTMTFSLLTLVVGSLLCGWTVLRCMGNERERQSNDLKARLASERGTADREAAAANAIPIAKSPQLAKPAR